MYKIGDKVKVIKRVLGSEDGGIEWGDEWAEEMDNMVGNVYKIEGIIKTDDYILYELYDEFDEGWVFPPSALSPLQKQLFLFEM